MTEIMKISEIQNQRIVDFFRVWKDTADQHHVPIPTKDMLGLRVLGPLSQHTMLYELDTDDTLMIRRSGSTVDDWWGSNMSGLKCADILAPETYADTVRFHKKLMTDPCAGYAHEWLDHNSGTKLECLSLVLPLMPTGEHVKGHTISLSSLQSRDYQGFHSGIYQELVSREVIDLRYFDLDSD